MSNTNSINNRQAQRGMGNGRSWRSGGRGQVNRGLSNPPLKGRTPIPQTTAGGHTQQSDAKSRTTSPSDAQTTRRRMNLMASVSRSSGLQKDGDEWVFFNPSI
jgi:hypothetical protein